MSNEEVRLLPVMDQAFLALVALKHTVDGLGPTMLSLDTANRLIVLRELMKDLRG